MSSVEEVIALMEEISNRKDLKAIDKSLEIIKAKNQCVDPNDPKLDEKFKSLIDKTKNEVAEEGEREERERIIKGMAYGLIKEGDEFWRPELLPQARELAQRNQNERAEKQQQEKQTQEKEVQKNDCCNLI